MHGEPIVTETIIIDEPFMMHHRKVVRHWVVALPGTSFRAEMTECPCGLRRQTGLKCAKLPNDAPRNALPEIIDVYSSEVIECLCGYAGNRCTRASSLDRDLRCHGWHLRRVERMLKELRGQNRASRLPSVNTRLTALGSRRTVPAKLTGEHAWFDQLVVTESA